jgi:sigma-B regulation protein RsbU (phosphoserine phosphatase)
MAHLSLRAKSLVALALACLLVLIPALLLGWQLSDGIRQYFAQAYGDNLTLLNRQKILAPIAVDLALSRRLANSEVTRQWLADEGDAARHDLFFREAESLRQELRDQAYFIASARSGNYYFNQQGEDFSDVPRYTLKRGDPADSWFYATLNETARYNINVNPDPKLGVTRVWINVRILDGERTMGISGASVDLTEFLGALTDSSRPAASPSTRAQRRLPQRPPSTLPPAYRTACSPGCRRQTRLRCAAPWPWLASSPMPPMPCVSGSRMPRS